jgi:hypothetical protein
MPVRRFSGPSSEQRGGHEYQIAAVSAQQALGFADGFGSFVPR